jgi:hypothetical protein
MILETIGIVFIAGAATLAAMFYERRMDVLHGPYIEGSVSDRTGLVDFLNSARKIADGLRWKARNMAYIASVIAF